MKKAALLGCVLLLVGLGLSSGPASAASGAATKFEKSFALVPDKEQKVSGVKVGEATIDSVNIVEWPDPDDFAKGDKDLNHTNSMKIVFTYTNRDLENDYKCKYTVTITDPKGSAVWGQADTTGTLDKGKVGDTNHLSVKLRTHQYKLAKTLKVTFEIWKK
ncbi:MAG: hypothetical protein ACHQPI_02270 [Thermoanaerobaculia bacterium]